MQHVLFSLLLEHYCIRSIYKDIIDEKVKENLDGIWTDI